MWPSTIKLIACEKESMPCIDDKNMLKRMMFKSYVSLSEGSSSFWQFEHVVRNLNVRPDSSLWHNRDNSVLLGSCESKQGQGGKLVKDTLNTVIFRRKQYHLIIMRDQNPPPPMTNTSYAQYAERANNTPPSMANMLNRVITSTLSSWGNKIRHPLWPICWTG